MRMCTNCKEWRDDDDFYRRGREKAARVLHCKPCYNNYSHAYYLKRRDARCESRATRCDITRAPAWRVDETIVRLQRSAVYYERQIRAIDRKDYPRHLHITLAAVSEIFHDYLDADEQSVMLYRRRALIRKDPDAPVSCSNFQLVDYEQARAFIDNIKKKAASQSDVAAAADEAAAITA